MEDGPDKTDLSPPTTIGAPAGGASSYAPATFRVILGEKVGCTQIFHPRDGSLRGVSVVRAGPCSVMRVKSAAGPDGYNALQLAYGRRREKGSPKSLRGQFQAAGLAPARWVREIRVADTKGFAVGQDIDLAAVFKAGDFVDVQGTSKGKGFAGVMKRHNFRGMPASHGASDKQRSPGSLTSRRSLGRVLPGQRMAGHLGAETVTVQKMEVVKVEPENHLLYLCGSVPGPAGGLVTVLETVKARKFYIEPVKSEVKKDKMGNIIGKKPTKAKEA